jgi:hypothetical protein
MNYKKIIISITILFIVGLVGYKIVSFMKKVEINTVSPQTSSSIVQSQKNGFLKQSYFLDTTTVSGKIDIKEAWIEDVWKNSFDSNGNLYKEKLGGVQLAINTSDFSKYRYDDKTFLVDWDIRLNKQELQGGGKGSSLYVFYLKDTIPPEKIGVIVKNKSEQSNKRKEIIFELQKSSKAAHYGQQRK